MRALVWLVRVPQWHARVPACRVGAGVRAGDGREMDVEGVRVRQVGGPQAGVGLPASAGRRAPSPAPAQPSPAQPSPAQPSPAQPSPATHHVRRCASASCGMRCARLELRRPPARTVASPLYHARSRCAAERLLPAVVAAVGAGKVLGRRAEGRGGGIGLVCEGEHAGAPATPKPGPACQPVARSQAFLPRACTGASIQMKRGSAAALRCRHDVSAVMCPHQVAVAGRLAAVTRLRVVQAAGGGEAGAWRLASPRRHRAGSSIPPGNRQHTAQGGNDSKAGKQPHSHRTPRTRC